LALKSSSSFQQVREKVLAKGDVTTEGFEVKILVGLGSLVTVGF
jgi:hypothetical protein